MQKRAVATIAVNNKVRMPRSHSLSFQPSFLAHDKPNTMEFFVNEMSRNSSECPVTLTHHHLEADWGHLDVAVDVEAVVFACKDHGTVVHECHVETLSMLHLGLEC